MELPTRKRNRLRNYDYSSPGAYFITVCLKDRKNLLWADVGASIARPHTPKLSAWGKIVETAICSIPTHYPAISLDHYVVMPNHIHLLLQINTDEHGRARPYGLGCRPADERSRYKANRSFHMAKAVSRPCHQKPSRLPKDMAIH